ncbi:MAG: nucleotide exchange factor GrpE [Spirochaetaceae bacterium]|nr:nucleotide exchange factor GrpE [Spirochaetaceae bacterium]
MPEQEASNNNDDKEKDELQSLKERIGELEELNADLQDKFLRKHADYENYRKRMVKEKGEAILYANADLMKGMLDVLDNFDRAEEAALAANDIEAVKAGVEMINKSLIELLTNKGLVKIATIGEEFNPEVHQAIAMAEDESGKLTKDTVVEEYQSGYKLNDRVLRPAVVKVAKAKT